MLHNLDLDRSQETVYRHLVEAGTATAESLAQTCALELPRVVDTLEGLRAAGLVTRLGAGRAEALWWEPAPPQLALGALLAVRQDELRAVSAEIAKVDASYRTTVARRGSGDSLEVVHGPENIRHRFLQLQRGAKREVLNLSKGPAVAVRREDNPAELTAIERGVHIRVVVEPAVVEQDLSLLTLGVSLGEEVRVAAKVPTKLVVVDREHALLPLHQDPEDIAEHAATVHAPGVVGALSALFEQVWQRARPLSGHSRGDDDRAIQALMLAGLTDEAIAQRINTSVRTVHRRIRRMMDRTGAATRFQLGWHLRDEAAAEEG
ncbi:MULTISPECIES: LuxR family transcriptional regulator [Streptomyces]|uniref:LuxR family transcriptional regulator n=1 Tax=Streptomyces evansiae TaxID=3075535 RepID=A0ABU2R2P9_9ACTN|nr:MULTISPECIES: LuxR family transcriptional regulator [unclassified Streptomyces]MDT0409545.1 LuxR family transcriptional regulator [Streptomyces sp. DSM 41979]MYQ57622.1 LuxR family transcriptional regulator [Streptomyces sp. SID4926]SCD76282.1 Sugar-specific transcriptional regulator TrmB [Streptomyces sp. DfronAA-171]